MVKDMLLAGAGGFVGSALRYGVAALMVSLFPGCGLPLGTLLVNSLGSLLIGVMWVMIPAGGWHTLVVAGFCGGFTTFSAFSLETLKMFRSGEAGLATMYIGISLAVCLFSVWIGVVVARKLIA